MDIMVRTIKYSLIVKDKRCFPLTPGLSTLLKELQCVTPSPSGPRTSVHKIKILNPRIDGVIYDEGKTVQVETFII